MKATDTFRHPLWRHNCAQAIAHRWRRLYADENIVDSYAQYIGGRAPEGLCGALFAAIEAAPEHADEIRREFEAECGAQHCRQIKTLTGTPCEHCVATADRLLEKFNPEGPR